MAATRRQFLAALAVSPGMAAAPATSDLRLWYRRPAPDWNEALPIGNGRLGAMVFGGVAREQLQLNEDTLYSDEPGRRDLPLDITKTFDQVVALLRRRRYAEAEQFINRHWLGRVWPCYQPLGDLYLEFDHRDREAAGYRRELDLSEAICRVRYEHGGVPYEREVFASHPDQVIVLRLRAGRPGRLRLRIRFGSPHPTARMRAAGDELVMTGQAPGLAVRRTLEWIEQRGEQWKYPELWDSEGKRRPHAKQVLYGEEIGGLGLRFEARLKASADGSIAAGAEELRIEDAREALLLLAAATSFNGFDKSPSREGADPAARVRSALAAAAGNSYARLRRAHVSDYRALFGRVGLRLGRPNAQSRLPTDERIERFANGRDPGLAALLFQFGRYLMIAGSRPGTQPLNLQGLWNREIIPPWAGAYTLNINLQMNYWPAEPCNLSECHEPLFRLARELAVNGRGVARRMYGRRGWVAHHNTTLWRCAQPVDYGAMPSFWPMAAGWLCRHLWEHYAFTGDRRFLAEEAYPLMKEAAEFYLDWLVEDPQGRLLTPVGVSPENRFRYRDSEGRERTAGVSMGPTMDLAILRDLFGNLMRASEILGRDEDWRRLLGQKLARLLPYQIGRRGQLQEWVEDFEEPEPRHRHLSHLYPLHPGAEFTRGATPELCEAARRSLELRGEEGSGWSRAWKINLWARLGEGERAGRLLGSLIQPARSAPGRYDRPGLLPNLFCSHPPFQIDGNFGAAAGIAEMLLQSHAGELHLLPALPKAWAEGSVRGLCARGGFEVSLVWRQGRLAQADLLSKLGSEAVVRYGEQTVRLPAAAGRYRLDGRLRRRRA